VEVVVLVFRASSLRSESVEQASSNCTELTFL
jgi:hypothetical protein